MIKNPRRKVIEIIKVEQPVEAFKEFHPFRWYANLECGHKEQVSETYRPKWKACRKCGDK